MRVSVGVAWPHQEAIPTSMLPYCIALIWSAMTERRRGVIKAEAGVVIIPRDHPLSSKAVADQLTEEGVDIRYGPRAESVSTGGAGRVVHLSDGTTAEGAELLLAVGRRGADLRALGAEEAGASIGERGVPAVDEQFRAADGLFVAGDAAGGLQFTHVADYEGLVTARAAMGGTAPATSAPSPSRRSPTPRWAPSA